jgi:redox-sensitive bicupin YhaK (pirin superfamily)
LLQIWILPDAQGVTPRYAEKSLADAPSGQWHLVTSKTARDGSIAIHQDAELSLARLDAGSHIAYNLAPGRHGWIHIAEGEVSLNGQRLEAGDAAILTEAGKLDLQAERPSQVLLFDLN